MELGFFFSEGFLLSLRNHGDTSHRGPLSILVLWLLQALLAGVWLRTSIALNQWLVPAIALCLHIVYGLSLLVSGRATYVNRQSTVDDVSITLTILLLHITLAISFLNRHNHPATMNWIFLTAILSVHFYQLF